MARVKRRDRPSRTADQPRDVRRVVNGPDGRAFEVVGAAKDWKLGTGSLLLDAAAFLWALVRQAKGKEWVVVVRDLGAKPKPLLTRTVGSREEAAAGVISLAAAIASGDLDPSLG